MSDLVGNSEDRFSHNAALILRLSSYIMDIFIRFLKELALLLSVQLDYHCLLSNKVKSGCLKYYNEILI